jgi:NAD/NADP transhydrogenase alpha subunit
MTKDELIGEYATRIVEGMDMDTLVAYATDQLLDALSTMSDEDLREEIADFYPDLLEEN